MKIYRNLLIFSSERTMGLKGGYHTSKELENKFLLEGIIFKFNWTVEAKVTQ